jgi:hypothetical protein
MSEKNERADNGPDAYACDSCGKVYPFEALNWIQGYGERVSAGNEVPAGECPDDDCGALCYPVPVEQPKPDSSDRPEVREQLRFCCEQLAECMTQNHGRVWDNANTVLANARAVLAQSPDRWAQHSPAFQAEHPWCGWTLAFAADSDWDTTAYGLERLVTINVLLTTADGRSRPVKITEWQRIEGGDPRTAGIEVHELETDHYETRDDRQPEFVPYEDIREIVVY